MRDDIERILKMVETGTLTRAQATEMIAALSAQADSAAGPVEGNVKSSGEQSDRPREGQGRRDHRRRQRRQGPAHEGLDATIEGLGDAIEAEVEQAINLGAKALRNAFKSSFQEDVWGDALFAKAEAPRGRDFVCEDNQIIVSQLRDVRLKGAEFLRNTLNAAGISDCEVSAGRFNDNALRGASLRHVLIERGDMTGNQINGGQISRLTLARSELTRNHFNGTQVRELGMTESSMTDSRCNGAKLRSVVLKADTMVKNLSLNGVVARSWLIDASAISHVDFKGLRIDKLLMDHCGLERCLFKRRERRDHRGADTMRDLTFEHTVLKDCRFVDCVFDHTTIRNLKLEGVEFREVDFSNRTFSSADELLALATERNVA